MTIADVVALQQKIAARIHHGARSPTSGRRSSRSRRSTKPAQRQQPDDRGVCGYKLSRDVANEYYLFRYDPGVWRHGDWIRITDRGTAVIYGRSDSTINRGGIRMGTAEIYRAVLAEDAGQLIGLTLILLGTARSWEQFDKSNALTYVFAGGMALLLIGLTALWSSMVIRRQPAHRSSVGPAAR